MDEHKERPPAQERWIVCYDLEGAAVAVLAHLELCAHPESQDMVPKLIKEAHDSALRLLKLIRMLRFGDILEGERPPEVLEPIGEWPENLSVAQKTVRALTTGKSFWGGDLIEVRWRAA